MPCLLCLLPYLTLILCIPPPESPHTGDLTFIKRHSMAQILPLLDWSSKHGGANIGGKQRQSYNPNRASSARGDRLRKLFHTTGAKVLYYISSTWMSGPTYKIWNSKLDWGFGVILSHNLTGFMFFLLQILCEHSSMPQPSLWYWSTQHHLAWCKVAAEIFTQHSLL